MLKFHVVLEASNNSNNPNIGKKSRIRRLFVFVSCHCEMLRLNTRGELEWHFWLHNQNEEEKRWTLSRNNRTSRQNNFTRATKAHYEIRALPSCATHIDENHKTSTIQRDLVRCASSFWAGLSPPKKKEFQIVKKINKT